MRKRFRIVLAAAALAVVCGLAGAILLFRLSNPPDPVYEGHRLSFWLEPPTGAASGGWAGLQHFHASLDSNAVPYLVHALRTRDGVMRRAYNGLWPHLPAWFKNRLPAPLPLYRMELVAQPGTPAVFTASPVLSPKTSARVRLEACGCLAKLGAKGRPAMPELIRLLHDDEFKEVRAAAATALGEIVNRDDQPAIEALTTAAARDPDHHVSDVAHDELFHVRYGSTF